MGNEFSDWCIFKLEPFETDLKCIICKELTKQRVTAVHVTFKKMTMGAICSTDCFDKYKVKYGI